MASPTFSVRSLGGKLQHFAVDPDTPIAEIRGQLDLNLPRFHETRLYLGDVELCNGSIAEANIPPGAEVQAVTTASMDKAVEASTKLPIGHPVLEFLEQHKDDLSKCHCEDLKKTLCDIGYDSSWFINHSPSDLLSRHVKLVCYLLGKLGDKADLEFLEEVAEVLENNCCLRSAAIDAAKDAVKEIEARTCKPPEEQPLQVNEHVQDPSNATGHMIGDPTQQVSYELEEAIRTSVAEACAREGADVQEALLRSKIDAIQQQQLVVLRLTKRNPNVLDALLKDPCLQKVRAQVEEAGCDILPDWANGGIVLAPLTEQQALEADVQLCAHHIVVSQQDQALMEQVLAAIPKRRRPGIKLADTEYLNASPGDFTAHSLNHMESMKTEPQCYLPAMEIWDGLWQVERTFVHCPLPQAPSENSRAVQSEPWGAAENSRPLKLPRLSPK